MPDSRACDQLNAELRRLYEEHWSLLNAHSSRATGVSNPHLMSAPPGYAKARHRLVIIGQQTNGWEFPDALGVDPIATLMSWSLGDWGTNFWRAAGDINQVLNGQRDRSTYVWGNLVKVDKNGDRATEDIELSLSRLHLLKEELAILAPDVVVFFTGPYFDDALVRELDGAEFAELNDGSPVRERAWIQHPSLPRRSVRTYHPNYLARGRWSWVEEIARTLTDDEASGDSLRGVLAGAT